MKKTLLFIVLLLAIATASIAQDYEVRSIEYLPEDMFAKINVRTERPNGGKKCAVLRIVTQNISPEDRKEFKFTPDMGSFIGDKETTDSEIRLWVSPEITFLNIDSKLGPLSIYFPDYIQGEIESLNTYRILIVGTRQEQTVIKQNINVYKGIGSCKIVFRTTPEDATIYLNDDSIGTRESQLPPGKYQWSISHPLYHTQTGSTVLIKGRTDTVDVALSPAYGYMRILDDYGLDEEVKVYLNGKPVGNVPFESEKLLSDKYFVAFEKRDVLIATARIEVKDNQISIDGIKEIFDQYYYNKQNMDSDQVEDSLSQVTTQYVPITGKLTINSVPASTINIDGNNYGSTPITIEELAVGTHNLTLTSPGCTPLSRTISVKEGEESIYNEQLSRACQLTIESDEIGDMVQIDGEYVGRTPVSKELPFGKHSISLKRIGKYQQTWDINLGPEQPVRTILLTFGQHVNVEADRNGNCIYVDGDYMGRTPKDIYLPHGKHTLRAERGWKAGVKTVNIEDGETIDNIKINTYYVKPKELLSNGAFFMTGNVALIQSGQPVYGFNIGDIANGGQAGWYFSIMANNTFINQLKINDFSLFNAYLNADGNGHIQNGSQVQYSGETSTLRASALFGVALKIAGPVYLRIGAGAGIRHLGWKTLETDQWVVVNPYSWKGFEASLGLQCCLYNFVLNADVLIPEDVLTESKKLFEYRVGFGYFLKHNRSKRQ